MLKKCYRYDMAVLKSPRKDSKGFLHADAIITKAGVFEYQMPDGTKRRELRSVEEVTKKESLDSLKGAPVTREHPPFALTSDNARGFSVGHVRDDVENVNGKIKAGVVVHDSQTIQECMDGTRKEMSGGYHCDLDETPGNHKLFGPYDAEQKNILYNHAAITTQGRQGHDVAMKMDSVQGSVECAVMIFNADAADLEAAEDKEIAKLAAIQEKEKAKGDDDEEGDDEGSEDSDDAGFDENGKKKKKKKKADKTNPSEKKTDGIEFDFVLLSEKELAKGENTMSVKFTIDAMTFELADSLAPMVSKVSEKIAENETLKSANAKLQGKCDGLEAQLKTDAKAFEEKLNAVRIDDKQAMAQAKSRIEVEEIGKKCLGEAELAKLDSMSTIDIKKAICLKFYADRKDSLEKLGESYVEGLFDSVRTMSAKEGFKHPDSVKLDSLLGDHAEKLRGDAGTEDVLLKAQLDLKAKMEAAHKNP